MQNYRLEEVIFDQAADVETPEARYKGFQPGTTILKKGSRYKKGAMPMPCDIIKERDVAIKMRDGITIYADIYRPDTEDKIPAILNWAPYGKGDTGAWFIYDFPNNFGVPNKKLSGLQSFEGNDPAYWCAQGYAIVQADTRGVFNSEGDIAYFSSQEGRDGYDTIEAIARMPWCSGKVGMAGNSWLAISQWRIAELAPPHLIAIAPWEGLTDPLRDIFCLGGIPNKGFPQFIFDKLYGRNGVENPLKMLDTHQLEDWYWEDKKVDTAKIKIPTYVVSSYTNPIHVTGTFRGWRDLGSEQKWLRIHNTVEWPDFYDPDYMEELKQFFDYYLKGIKNNWERMPQVRMSVLDPGHQDVVNRKEDAFPPSDLQKQTLYLEASEQTLMPELPQMSASTSYQVDGAQTSVDFLYRFEKNTEIVGYPNLKLWVSAEGSDDADIYVQMQKLDKNGKQLWHQTSAIIPMGRTILPIVRKRGVEALENLFFGGADGMLRVSRRKLKEGKQDPLELTLDCDQKLADGEIVEIVIPILPIAMRWHAGEQLCLRISAKPLKSPALPGLPKPEQQKGERHWIYTGKDHDSALNIAIKEF